MSKVIAFSKECQKKINEQISAELHASYTYRALYAYFSRHDVALFNVASFFKKSSDEESSHANLLIDYLNQRGGTVAFPPIKGVELGNISLLQAFTMTLDLEKSVHQKLIALHKQADEDDEYQFADFIESTFLSSQVEDEHKIVGFITKINRVGVGLGEYIFDRDFIV